MIQFLIGRESELKILERFLHSNVSEFLVIYGRRRVGKTFLVREFFEGKEVIFFDVAGAKDAPLKEQIKHFTKRVGEVFYKKARLVPGKNWDEAFELLTNAVNGTETNKKIILFFDEFPWMATKNSRVLQGLDYYWNQYWSKNNRIKLIICGSSASWIIEKIVNNKGGLHNRLTRNIFLEPFNLLQTKKFLENISVNLTNKQITELFMVMGGIPYYLSKLEGDLSSTQLIEKLAFKKKNFLLEEFDNLFSSLFNEATIYIDVIRLITSHRYGIGQEELLKKMGKALKGKGGIEKFKALQDASFIMGFKPHLHKTRGIYYRVIDEYCMFYFHWIEPVKNTLLKKSLIGGYWDKLKAKQSWYSWAGLAFESVCYEHLPQITKALSINPTAIPNTWRYVPKEGTNEQGAQIDLLFDRDDDSITICEIKYSNDPFVITKECAEKLKQKIEIFRRITRTNKQIFISMISANGVKPNQYSAELISRVVTLNDLFIEV
ncbi:MAG: ATP-binding protein [Coxiellaceae bacterium]|jgi:AAA+ ATPase superfamily predicted ATPase|nr:ATP-binding protein [Coxiellaceae bacterium]